MVNQSMSSMEDGISTNPFRSFKRLDHDPKVPDGSNNNNQASMSPPMMLLPRRRPHMDSSFQTPKSSKLSPFQTPKSMLFQKNSPIQELPNQQIQNPSQDQAVQLAVDSADKPQVGGALEAFSLGDNEQARIYSYDALSDMKTFFTFMQNISPIAQILSNKFKMMEQEHSNFSQCMDSQKSQIDSQSAFLAGYCEQLKKISQQLEKFQDVVALTNSKYNSFLLDLREYKQNIEKITEIRDFAHEFINSTLEEHKKLSNEHIQVKNELNALNDLLENERRESLSWESKYKEIKLQLEEESKIKHFNEQEYSAKEANWMKEKENIISSHLSELSNTTSRYENEIRSMIQNEEILKNSCGSLKIQLSDLNLAINEKESFITLQNSLIAESQKNLAALKLEYECSMKNLTDQLEEESEAHKSLILEFDESKEKAKIVENQYVESKNESDRLKEIISKLEKQHDEQISALKGQVASSALKINELEAANQEKSQEIAVLNQSIKTTTEEKIKCSDLLKNQMIKHENDRGHLESKYRTLEAKYQGLLKNHQREHPLSTLVDDLETNIAKISSNNESTRKYTKRQQKQRITSNQPIMPSDSDIWNVFRNE